ncbi:PIR Superfamily Protein [Plasmodium ovale wallikeri]|uniref:PIR Superfamily Protein n=1 Tax=Plasmodium ovale wallikeri TaxID=864142 RepID=A0A1A8YQ54_PLAOA|nr:PIR Superfamily Protein [Plasmodium ovale wallikeri]SBT33555.1 PIR Superfamily Protein [Plasmodium ovale wallikeri]
MFFQIQLDPNNLKDLPSNELYDEFTKGVILFDYNNYCRDVFSTYKDNEAIKKLYATYAKNFKIITGIQDVNSRITRCNHFLYWMYNKHKKDKDYDCCSFGGKCNHYFKCEEKYDPNNLLLELKYEYYLSGKQPKVTVVSRAMKQNDTSTDQKYHENLEASPANSNQTSGILQQFYGLYNSSSFHIFFSFSLRFPPLKYWLQKNERKEKKHYDQEELTHNFSPYDTDPEHMDSRNM